MIHAAESAFNDGLQVSPGLAVLLNGLGEIRQRQMLDAYSDHLQMFPRPFITVSWSAALPGLAPSTQWPALPSNLLPAPDSPTPEPSSNSENGSSETASSEVLGGNDVSMLEKREGDVCAHVGAQVRIRRCMRAPLASFCATGSPVRHLCTSSWHSCLEASARPHGTHAWRHARAELQRRP